MSSMTRSEAIAHLRTEFLKLTDDDHSICSVAAERGIFCHGFLQFSEEDLRKRYWWIVCRRPSITRAELEQIANAWQLTQQEVRDVPLACDVQTRLHDTCRGWDDFTNEQLATAYQQLTGEAVSVL